MITWKQTYNGALLHSYDGFVHGVCQYYIHHYHAQQRSACGVGCDHEEYASSQLEEYESPDALEMAKNRCESHFADWIASINVTLAVKSNDASIRDEQATNFGAHGRMP